jgi:hypothetical protein
MIRKCLAWIVTMNYVKCGLRYGGDQESIWYTGEINNKYYATTYRFWSKQYHKMGYRLIDVDTWHRCLYDKHLYKRFLKIKRY